MTDTDRRLTKRNRQIVNAEVSRPVMAALDAGKGSFFYPENLNALLDAAWNRGAATASPESLSVSQEDPIPLELSRLRSVEQQYLVLIRQSCGDGERAAPTEAEPSGWLIELWDHKTGIFAAQWWSLDLPDDEDGRGWTKDSLQALRFARERDAQAYIDETGWTEAKPTEHAWEMK